ncbi:MAG: hypothetical protein HFE78_02910 [Clostridiales bacterium]|nr:hypothetical protein [Clostridiales bacterium]
MKNLYFFLLLFIIQFLLSCVVLSFVGIYAAIFSYVLLVLILVRWLRKEKIQFIVSSDFRAIAFYTIAFAGVILLSLPLRFMIEAAVPALCLKLNIVSAFGVQAYIIKMSLYILSFAAMMTCLCRAAVTCAKDFRLLGQMLLCGGFMAVFSFSIPALLSNFLLGAFLGWLLYRSGNLLLCFFYTALYRAVFLLIDFYSDQAGKPYGQMMTGLSIAGMFCLFLGMTLLFTYFADILVQKRKLRANMLTVSICIVSALLIVIGCAITQYANM